MTTLEKFTLPGYLAGTWAIDPERSYVGFVITHALVVTVRGQFENVTGEIITGQNILDSRLRASIDAGSFHADSEIRDEQVRSSNFLDVERYPSLTFTSTKILIGDGFRIEGALTLHGVTQPVILHGNKPRFGSAQDGQASLGISASTVIRRRGFGVTVDDSVLPGGGLMLSEDVDVMLLEIEAILQK